MKPTFQNHKKRIKNNGTRMLSDSKILCEKMRNAIGGKFDEGRIDEIGSKLSNITRKDADDSHIMEMRSLIVDICLLSDDPSDVLDIFNSTYEHLWGLARSARSGSAYCDVVDKNKLKRLKESVKSLLTPEGLRRLHRNIRKSIREGAEFSIPAISNEEIHSVGNVVAEDKPGPVAIDTTQSHIINQKG